MTIEISTDTGIKWNASGYEKIADNISNILKTKMNEVPYLRDMGINPSNLDMPITTSKGQIISDAIDAITTYEPRATISEIDIVEADENGDITIKVVANFE